MLDPENAPPSELNKLYQLIQLNWM